MAFQCIELLSCEVLTSPNKASVWPPAMLNYNAHYIWARHSWIPSMSSFILFFLLDFLSLRAYAKKNTVTKSGNSCNNSSGEAYMLNSFWHNIKHYIYDLSSVISFSFVHFSSFLIHFSSFMKRETLREDLRCVTDP